MASTEIDRDTLFFKSLPRDFILGDSTVERRLIREYGAVFVARGGLVAPNKVVFQDEAEVSAFQSGLEIRQGDIGGLELELQSTAMDALLAAVAEAERVGLSITPRGPDSARRNYDDTIELWNSRVEPALVHWVARRRITIEDASEIRGLAPYEQVPKVFELEEQGIYFAKDLSKSIIYSVAPPGASQHLSLLAFDVREFDDAKVRHLLADHYWYQTVVSDLPHFTFLGVEESKLHELGLRREASNSRAFWVPDI